MAKKFLVSEENEITCEDFLAVSRRVSYNSSVAKCYEEFAKEEEFPYTIFSGKIRYGKDPNFAARAKAVRECGKKWDFDFYPQHGVKNLIRMNRCKDRFCLNCQSLEADQRFAQYSGVLDTFARENDLYHIVFTVPNVLDEDVADTVTLLLDRFSYLIRFFDGRKKIRGVDFEKYGYLGAVRSLEITVSKSDGSYHPHLHTMFILKKGLDMSQVYWNRFSPDYRNKQKPPRLYSEFEVLLQRIWCLLLLRIEVTKYNIEHIAELCDYPDGFSVHSDPAGGDYHEIFKYAIKPFFEKQTEIEKNQFRILYKALFDRRAYETYGCLKKWDFNEIETDLGLSTPDAAFDLWIASMQRSETPKRVQEILTKIILGLNEGVDCKYISKATYVRHFRAMSEEDKIAALKALAAEE